MRRPPDKEGQPGMSERDVDSSNATLNTLFGGARQKSWMLGPRVSVRPTPRSSISKASGHNATSVFKNTAAVLPTPALSDDLIPVVPQSTIVGGVQIRSQWQAQGNETVRQESGAQRPVGGVTRPGEAVSRPLTTQTQPGIPQSLPQMGASSPGPVSANPYPLVPRSTLAASPSTSTAQSLADGQAAFRTVRELRSPSLPLHTSDQGHDYSSPDQPEFRRAAPPANEINQQYTEAQQPPREQLLSPSPVPFSPQFIEVDQPPLPSSVLLPSPNLSKPIPSSGQLNLHKRQRIQVPPPSLRGRVALIKAHIESVGGYQYLNTDLERPRFQLLTQACNEEDTFYVALHQLFCIWDSPWRRLISLISDFPQATTLQISFKVLGNLIRENKSLAPNHLKWFVNFPSPFTDLMRTSEAYQTTVRNVGQYLGRLSSDWGPFAKSCATRGYPPLVDELIQRMGLTSPILQQIMFTATRRNLGVEDDKYGQQMEKIFSEDKQGHQELAARFNTGRPPTEKEIIERNQSLIDKYLAINNHRIRSRRVSGPVMAGINPVANAAASPNQVNIQHTLSSSSNGVSVAPRPPNVHPNGPNENQSFPSPNAWHQNQLVQQARVLSNPSLNLLATAGVGAPPSGSDYRAYSDAPSPTMLQSLSMNSPVIQSPGVQQQGFQWPTPVLRDGSFQAEHPMAVQSTGMAPAAPQHHLQQQVMAQQQQQIAAQQQQQLTMEAQQWQQQQHQHQQFLSQMPQQGQPQFPLQTQQQMHQHAIQARQAQRMQRNQSVQQAHPLVLQQIPQQQIHQRQPQQILSEQRQYLATGTQQVLPVSRAAQLRSNGEPIDVQQRLLSRINSITNIGQMPTHSNSPSIPLTRPIPSFIPSPIIQKQVVDAYINAQPLQRALAPPLGYQQSSQPYNPDLTALHQAHVRSPHLVPENTFARVPDDDPSLRFYQSVRNLAVGPVKIPVSSSISLIEFGISEESLALISKDRVIGTDRVPVREFKRGSLQYRLRCISSNRDTTKCLLPDWIISDTAWPETVFVEVNGHQLEVRRKHHHGKDLPIDITQIVVAKTSTANVNRVKISIPRLRKAMREHSYFVAVEVVEVLQHTQIMEMCTQNNRIPSLTTLDAIKKSLAPSPTEDDDDFAMVVSDLSIDLADPWTARIFEIPVRGSSCLHRECFDLETFLVTRNSKPKRPNQPSMIDIWKCPLCGKDARPYSLRVDDFLVGVRAELAAQDNLDAKAILVSANGSWRAKPEPRSMKRKATGDIDDDGGSSDGEGTARRQQAVGRRNNPYLNGSGRVSKEVEVIDLDDD